MRAWVAVALLCTCLPGYAQPETNASCSDFRIMFYNVENLFDPFHDSLKNDYEFVSGGIKGWTWKKFEKKLNSISKVIINAGGWQPPEIVALCEVENRFVLIQLLKRTPLERFGYRIIHVESPDERGIDVCLLYRSDKFKELSHQAIRVCSTDSSLKTRDILYVKGLLKNNGSVNNSDTLHIFVNHWPSRSGGIALSADKRKDAALTLKAAVDSIMNIQPQALIVLTGDFNDEPSDESLTIHLGAGQSNISPDQPLVNLMAFQNTIKGIGTNKYKGQWGIIDQFIVSSNLLHQHCNGVKVSKAEILNLPFLLQNDETFSGTTPFRTFNGMQYLGGFSDHLPVMLTLNLGN